MNYYYLIEKDYSPRETGVFEDSQVYLFKKDLKSEEDEKILCILRNFGDRFYLHEKYEKHLFPFLNGKLNPKTILTDFISVAPVGLLYYFAVNNKVTEILKKHNLLNCIFIKLKLYDQFEWNENYNLLCLSLLDFEIVDFSKSVWTFSTNPWVIAKERKSFEIGVDSPKDFKRFSDEDYSHYPKRVCLQSKFKELDLFYFSGCRRFIVSEKLKKALLTAKVKGIKFEEIDFEIIS